MSAPFKNNKKLALKLAIEAKRHAGAGDKITASSLYKKAISLAPADTDVITLVADGFSEQGERDEAINILHIALTKCEPTEAILTIIGRLATQMSAHGIAEKVFQAAISLNPGNPANYTNLANSYRMMEKYDEGIEVIQNILPAIPQAASLWNVLGTLLFLGKKDYANAETFYQEALRLEPKNDQVLLNLANLHGHTPKGENYYRKAIAANPSNHMAHIGLALYLLEQGNLQEGWKHYEHRRKVDSSYTSAVFCTNKLPLWKGKDLKNKTILVMPEQGIGDEVFFAINFPRLISMAKNVIIGCDPRLKTIYQRSFPSATITAYEDVFHEGRRYRRFPDIENKAGKISEADCAVWAGSIPQYFWATPEDIPRLSGGYLQADPELVDKFSARMKTAHNGPKIGLSWRSGNISANRDEAYFGLRGAHLLTRWVGEHTDFFCLQYGWQLEEVTFIREKAERDLLIFKDVDLKADIEANLAIMANMDLVIGPSIATQQFAIASGIKTKMITSGLPWWCFGEKNSKGPSYIPHCEWYQRKTDNFEEPILQTVFDIKMKYPDAPFRTATGITDC